MNIQTRNMRGIRLGCVLLFYFLTAESLSASQDHIFTGLLKAHVKAGRAAYNDLCQDRRLDTYLSYLASIDPDSFTSKKEQLAFWINVYNAYTLKIICENYPLKSISQLHGGGLMLGSVLKTTVWDKDFVIVNGRRLTLNMVEHKILRPQYKDPRIHFAIVCAAKGCPPLRSEAYDAERLDAQLDEQGRIFLSQQDKNVFDLDRKVARISPIFGWFKEDFGTRPRQVLLFISRFIGPDIAASLRENGAAWRIRYSEYDWSLND